MATAQNQVSDDNTNNQSQTSAPAGAQPATAPPGSIGGNQKVNKLSAEPAAGVMGTSEELPGRRVYNPLSLLSSYTYNISLYMVTAEAYNVFALSGGRIVGNVNTTNAGSRNGFYIVAQSGGINNTNEARGLTFSGSPGDKSGGFDYFIDDLTFETITPGKDGTSTPTNSINFKFKITETTGFNFLTKMTDLSRRLMSESTLTKDSKTEKLPFQQHFMIGIRFYGYDAQGNVVTSKLFSASDSATATGGSFSQSGSTDSTAIFERFYPVNITNITFKIDGRSVVYSCDAVGISLQNAFGEKRGLIKNPTEIFASNVGEALVGVSAAADNAQEFWASPNATGAQANGGGRETAAADPRTATASSANPTGNKTPKPVTKVGLLEIINTTLNDETVQNKRKIPPKYYVQFGKEASSIKNALLKNNDPQSAGGSGASRTKDSNVQASNNSKNAVTNGVRIPLPAGMPIIQAIDNIISQSSFIDDASIVINDTNPEVNPENKTPTKKISWYSVNPVVKITGLDNKTNDWVYDVCYQIEVYDIPYIRTPYRGVSSKYYGPHKRYEYWFTGKNTEILNYEQQFDSLYYTVSTTSTGADKSTETNNAGPTVPVVAQGGSNSRVDGPKTNRAGLVNQNIKASLYSTADQAKATIKIIGDPDYLFQTVLGSPSLDSVYSKRYGPGFTINPNGGQVFIEIQFNNATDYGTDGLLNVSDQVSFYPTTILRDRGVKGLIYQVTQVTSTFSRGKFEQTLDLLLVDERLLLSDDERRASGRVLANSEEFVPGVTDARTNNNTDSSNNVGMKEDNKPAPNNPGGNVSNVEDAPIAAQLAQRTITTNAGFVVDDDGSFEL